MYVDFEYYKTEYGGAVFKSEVDMKPYERKAERRVDTVTGGKLGFAFPSVEKDAAAVKDCVCELTEFLYNVDRMQQSALENTGTTVQENGIVRGKVVTSISSGSESISYSASAAGPSVVTEAAKDRKVFDMSVYAIVRDSLSGVPDANGVNLLYAGEYPGECAIWE